MKRLMTILANNQLKIEQYLLLAALYHGELGFKSLDFEIIHLLGNKGLVTITYPESNAQQISISDAGKSIVESVEALFKKSEPAKKKSDPQLVGKIDEYLELWPEGKLPSGKRAKVNAKNLEPSFTWFLSKYKYDWRTILAATELYIMEYAMNNYKYMRTSQYFISKTLNGIRESELANYCDRVVNGDISVKDENFSDKVV